MAGRRSPLLIGGCGRGKRPRRRARHADLWNGFGDSARIAETSAVLRERCEEVGRDFDSIERTVTMDVVIRDDEATARADYAVTEEIHGIKGRVGSDGSPRGLSVGGAPDAVAAYLRPFVDLGIGEVTFVFRHPFDLETIHRVREVRAALKS